MPPRCRLVRWVGPARLRPVPPRLALRALVRALPVRTAAARAVPGALGDGVEGRREAEGVVRGGAVHAEGHPPLQQVHDEIYE